MHQTSAAWSAGRDAWLIRPQFRSSNDVISRLAIFHCKANRRSGCSTRIRSRESPRSQVAVWRAGPGKPRPQLDNGAMGEGIPEAFS